MPRVSHEGINSVQRDPRADTDDHGCESRSTHGDSARDHIVGSFVASSGKAGPASADARRPRDLHPRARGQRAALPQRPDRRQLGGLPRATPAPRCRRPRRRVRAGDDHRRHRRARRARPGAGHRAGARAAGARPGARRGRWPAWSSRSATSTPWTSPTPPTTSCTPTRCCSTSPTRSRRCGRCCASAAPDGVVGVRDADYAAMAWYPADPRLDRWLSIYRAVARGNGAEPDAGRRLLSWARAAGAADIVATASVWCYATPADRQWWGGMWADRILESAITGHATGRRPRRPRRAGRHLRGLAALGGRRRRLVPDPARRGGVPPASP